MVERASACKQHKENRTLLMMLYFLSWLQFQRSFKATNPDFVLVCKHLCACFLAPFQFESATLSVGSDSFPVLFTVTLCLMCLMCFIYIRTIIQCEKLLSVVAIIHRKLLFLKSQWIKNIIMWNNSKRRLRWKFCDDIWIESGMFSLIFSGKCDSSVS